MALWILIGGVAVSGALYLGFKNRPGAYQGSPSFYMDPSQAANGFQSAVVVPSGVIESSPNAAELQHALTSYAASLQMLDGYYILVATTTTISKKSCSCVPRRSFRTTLCRLALIGARTLQPKRTAGIGWC